jgi:hypothetical protein
MKRATIIMITILLFASCMRPTLVPEKKPEPAAQESEALRHRMQRLEKLVAALQEENRLLKDRFKESEERRGGN